MTTLEKAARVVEASFLLWDQEVTKSQALAVSRAVLMAVREPSESEITDLQEIYGVSFAATFKLRYRDMIDAILNEEPK